MTRHHYKANPLPHSGCRQRNQADFRADFFAAFFSFRGSPLLFFFSSFGTRTLAGFATPTAAAIFPAASPTALAAFTSAPSCNSGDVSAASFFFAMPAILSFSEADALILTFFSPATPLLSVPSTSRT